MAVGRWRRVAGLGGDGGRHDGGEHTAQDTDDVL